MDTGNKVSRLSKIARDLNVGIATIVEFLNKQGIKMTPDPNAKIDAEAQVLLEKQFRKDHDAKVEADMHRPGRLKRDTITIEDAVRVKLRDASTLPGRPWQGCSAGARGAIEVPSP